ncbi:Protein of unknown function DUF761, plant [Dillenia turbinata]|uniref:Avr9/Cf-9 rapidly elicited protein n=1 Tax=Dillenia turbinata TaxID=194707 RepID=A0AAN8UKS0_9MAGN
MVRKGMSKRKLLVDLNMMMKRGKIAGTKAFHNLKFRHHRNTSFSFTSASSRDQHVFPTPSHSYYEFSCSNTPVHTLSSYLPFHLHKHRTQPRAADAPSTADDMAVDIVLEMLKSSDLADDGATHVASAYLPGFRRSPMVRPLRITDSPFPLPNMDDEETRQVNKAAEDFIKRFYNDLKTQSRITE